MADEFNNANNGQLPDDLTQILNDANPENIMPENIMPANTNPETIGAVHIPRDGVQGETLGDNFDIDTLLNQTAQAVSPEKTADILKEEDIYHGNTQQDIPHTDHKYNIDPEGEHASVQKVEPTVVTVPGFDIETTAMASVPLQIVAEIGNTELRIEQLMKIGRGAIIEIDKDIESSLELKIGHHLIGQGHLESDGEYFQIRVVNMIADIDEHHTLFYASNE